ncbi:hypothetical protein GCM10007874_09720 [Labrys miyagiensis]|uniref:Aldehyde oxidase/xanthine dehydrogenase a/b hammerhead domain-containing protein n=1 Tax=Labrys miyagiensis TaxID=346912 RepID=A0ABQ6CCH8_9HYPH|nr:hypothetical protein [Labrys miyagiensis]GLS17956.1 hypothetical protein GCM10007874_09720 [Labrys miyagiensis]
MLETKIGRRDALRGIVLAAWAVGLATLSFMEGIAPLPALSLHAANVVEATPPAGRSDTPRAMGRGDGGLVYGVFAASAPSAGRIATLDLAAAQAAPGVIAVYPRHAERATSANGTPVGLPDPAAWQKGQYALVLARTPEQASHAAGLIGVTYAPRPADPGLHNAVVRVPTAGQGDTAPDCLAAWKGATGGQPSNS